MRVIYFLTVLRAVIKIFQNRTLPANIPSRISVLAGVMKRNERGMTDVIF